MSNIYCGIAKIPKGKKRGTANQCLKAKQVRYYGVEAIVLDEIKKILSKDEEHNQLIKEQLKLKKLEDDGVLLIKNFKNIKLKIELRQEDGKSTKTLDKQLQDLQKKKVTLLKKIKKQRKLINDLKD
jgi:hypothetical protein